MSPADHPAAKAGQAGPAEGTPKPPALRVRQAGRVILLDPDNRVLLMRYDDGPPNGVHWSTPGGGLNLARTSDWRRARFAERLLATSS